MAFRQAISVYFGKHIKHINKMATTFGCLLLLLVAHSCGLDDLGFYFLPGKKIYLLP
jgi:hypothetical protein